MLIFILRFMLKMSIRHQIYSLKSHSLHMIQTLLVFSINKFGMPLRPLIIMYWGQMPREVCTPSKPLFTQMAAIFGTLVFMYFFHVKFQWSLIFEFFGTLFTFELIYTIVHIVYMFVNVTLKFGGKITASLTVIFIFERAIISSIFTVSISCKREKIILGTQCTMLQKLSKCEVKAWLCWNLIILPPLRFYVKSNFGEFEQSKNVILETLNFEFW